MDDIPDKSAASERRYTTISIPQPLYLEIKRAIEGTGFRSPTEFLVYVTRTSLQDLRPPMPSPQASVANPLLAFARTHAPVLSR
ncbi:MAG: hypothetical protein WDA16_03570 [Candidatus Thermoplasmatota archaeon]